jgi:hypothetical protein
MKNQRLGRFPYLNRVFERLYGQLSIYFMTEFLGNDFSRKKVKNGTAAVASNDIHNPNFFSILKTSERIICKLREK